jgi:hypothetical protein
MSVIGVIVFQKSQKAHGEFYAKGQSKRELPINAASKPFPESPVSLPHGGEVPHIIFRYSRLRLGNLESHAAKRLLQHYRR